MVKYYVDRIQEEIFKLLDCITDEKETLSSRISSTGSGLRELSKMIEDYNKETLGETNVRWLRADIENEFSDRYERNGTDEEIDSIIDYLELDDKGGESAIEAGWNHIYSAFDEWEKDNSQEEEIE